MLGAAGALGGADGVLEQHRYGHRPDPAGHRRDERGLLFDALEIDIANQLAVGQAVNADIDRAGADHLRHDEPRRARGNDEDIGEDRVLREVARLRVTDRNRRLALHQHQGHRLADNVAGADDGDILAFELDAFMLKNLLNAIGRARREDRVALNEAADIVEMKPVDILRDRDGLEHARHSNRRRQRQLHEDAVHRRVDVELHDPGEQFLLAHLERKFDHLGFDSDIAARTHLVAHIDRRGGIVANHDHGQRRRDAFLRERLRALRDADPHLLRNRDAVNDFCRHRHPARRAPRPPVAGYVRL
jgi:hypothetical protein